MLLNRWYKQTFRNGDSIYFLPVERLKNGNVRGKQYSLFVDRPRARAKGKQASCPSNTVLWTLIEDTQVPIDLVRS